MKTWVRIVIGVTGAIVILVVAALCVLKWRIDPNDYRHEIDAAIAKKTGRAVTINGPIRLSVFPWPAVHFGSLTVANAPGFGDRPLARIRSAHITLRVLPLCIGRIELGTLDIDGLDLALARAADGKTNWQGVVRRLSRAAPAPTPEHEFRRRVSSKPAHAALPLSSLKIGAVEIAHANVRYDDAAHDRHFTLDHADLHTGRISNGHPFRLEASGDLTWPGANMVAGLHMVSRFEPNVADRFYRFSGLSLNILARGKAVPGGEQEANLGASGDLDLEAGRFGLDDVSLQSVGLTVTGNIDGAGLNDRLEYNGRITVSQFSPRSVLQQLKMHAPQTQSGSALTFASFDAQFEGGAHAVHFKQIAARLDGSTLSGTADVHDFAVPRYGFDLYLDKLDIDNYLPPGSAAQARTSQPARHGGGAAQKAAEFDLSPLAHLRMHGALHAGSLTTANLNIQNAVAKLSVGHDVLDLAPLTAELYGGALHLTGRIDAGAPHPRYRLAGRLRHVDLAALLDDAANSKRLQGRANIDVDLHARGRQVAELKRTLGGSAGIALDQGRVNGVDLAGMLVKARANGAPADATGSGHATEFNHLDARFAIADGVATSRAFAFDAGALTGRGHGHYSLPDNRLDYTIDFAAAPHADQRLAPLAGLRVPMHLRGALLAPAYDIDMKHARSGAVRPAADVGP